MGLVSMTRPWLVVPGNALTQRPGRGVCLWECLLTSPCRRPWPADVYVVLVSQVPSPWARGPRRADARNPQGGGLSMNLLVGAQGLRLPVMGSVQSPIRASALSPAPGSPPRPSPPLGAPASLRFFPPRGFPWWHSGAFYTDFSFRSTFRFHRKIQRFHIQPLSPHGHSLPHCPHPAPESCVWSHE